MGGFIDLTGQKFHKLTVISRAPNRGRQTMWFCICDCGNEKTVGASHLKSGHTKSCGCYNVEKVAERNKNTKKKTNKYDLSGEYGIGWTSNTNKEFYFDLEDYDKIKEICWSEKIRDGFSMIQGYDIKSKCVVAMHVLLGYKDYDHIDRNELNNRKVNLRIATKRENSINRSLGKNNTSGVTGVRLYKPTNKWLATINKEKRKTIRLYYGTSFEDAVVARLKAEKKYYGEFAPQQHLYKEYGIDG